MAMKVSKSTIYRLSVELSCGCMVFAEFDNAQCKEPEAPSKTFVPCEKHKQDTSLSILEFMVGERLDEVVEIEKTKPTSPVHHYAVPGIEKGDTGGVVATGESVQSIARVNIRNRPEDPTVVKTLQVNRPVAGKRRTASSASSVAKPALVDDDDGISFNDEIHMEEAEENENLTSNIIDLFDEHDPTEFPA